MPTNNLQVQPAYSSQIGQPVAFVSGVLANRTIRIQVSELQSAELGRKCGNVDRRPLDPPPVVQLRVFEVVGWSEYELRDLSELVAHGFVCFVDLFPCPYVHDCNTAFSPGNYANPPPSAAIPGSSTSQTLLQRTLPAPPRPIANAASLFQSPPVHLVMYRLDQNGPGSHQTSEPSALAYLSPLAVRGPEVHGQPTDTSEVAAYVNGIAILEQSCCTDAFVGNNFESASCLEFQGVPVLLAVFPDLAVKATGKFLMRYRVVNLVCRGLTNSRRPVLAECWGGPFRVYSTKECPGLPESTELTKILRRYGIPVHVRRTERRKRKDVEADEDTESLTGGGTVSQLAHHGNAATGSG